MTKYLIALFLGLCLSTAAIPALASGHGEPEPEVEDVPAEPEVSYYTINPDFTTNVATLNPREKPHYIRVKMSLMLSDSADTPIVTEMEPVIKDAVVSVLGAKDFSTVSSNSGREKIRAECREKIVAIMQDKIGRQVVDDVLFLNYMYQ
ncbi:MAG: flagellar basal body-associated FliL family protein [Succinivibrio sp.]|nr:flagellar basal body-associated FliL family protein [Succinivibrio sp.]